MWLICQNIFPDFLQFFKVFSTLCPKPNRIKTFFLWYQNWHKNLETHIIISCICHIFQEVYRRYISYWGFFSSWLWDGSHFCEIYILHTYTTTNVIYIFYLWFYAYQRHFLAGIGLDNIPIYIPGKSSFNAWLWIGWGTTTGWIWWWACGGPNDIVKSKDNLPTHY